MDIYSDHQVRQYEYNGVPLSRIDNMAFMIGTTNTCYDRGKNAWKGMLILFLARGGWANTYYGNLDLITDHDARWFAKAQSLFLPFQQNQAISTFGVIPGMAGPYGYLAQGKNGAVITLVNPTQSFETVDLPVSGKTRLLFTDAGYLPKLDQTKITLGPEQMAVVGIQEFADPDYELGQQKDILIPVEINQMKTSFVQEGENTKVTKFDVPPGKDIRVIWQQFDSDSIPERSGVKYSSKGVGETTGEILIIRAEQNGNTIPVEIHYDRFLWSGLSWAAGEIRAETLNPSQPLSVTCISGEPENLRMRGRIYSVVYK
jgi:hypothetical protein